MTVQIKLTDRQLMRLEQLRQVYADNGLDFTIEETFEIVFRTHAKEYLDRELERVEAMLNTKMKDGRRKHEKHRRTADS